jgi:1,2-diacylglycerol 3-alpha-glucosyltransferase
MRTCELRIAIASSGLGHIARGVETWAEDTARALLRAGQRVTLFQGSGQVSDEWRVSLDCRKRFDDSTARLVKRWRPFSGWRFGYGSGYEAEQTSFAWKLWRKVRKDFDIVHVQDPQVALILDRLHRLGVSRPRVILAHGTEETPQELVRYSFLQHLAPVYAEQWVAQKAARQYSTAVPNFVDVQRFSPCGSPAERAASRERWGLSDAGLVVLCVAAIKKHHKRCDYVIREFRRFLDASGVHATLVIAGARERESEEVMALGRDLLGERVRFVVSAPRAELPSLYRAADMFCLASLHEMMPIAVLEAMASGLPVVVNGTPTLRWMGGEGGVYAEMDCEGALAAALCGLQNSNRRTIAGAARRRALDVFSEAVVVPQILAMYDDVLAWNAKTRFGTTPQEAEREGRVELEEVKG